MQIPIENKMSETYSDNEEQYEENNEYYSESEQGSQVELIDLVMTPEITEALYEIIDIFSTYISSYIHLLNKFISHLRRVGSMKYERTMLIKYVKKFRFFNDSLVTYKENMSIFNWDGESLRISIAPLMNMFVKILEVLDLLNFYFTQALQKEIVSKTLNFDLTLSDECKISIEDTYNHFAKYVQWSFGSLGTQLLLAQLEVINFAMKCAEENDEDAAESDNIFLHDVELSTSEEDYTFVTQGWSNVLNNKIALLESQFSQMAIKWHEKFGKKK